MVQYRIQQCLWLPVGWDQQLPFSKDGYAQSPRPISLPPEPTVCLLTDKATLMLTPCYKKTTNMASFGNSLAQVHVPTGHCQGGTCVLPYLLFLVPVPGMFVACMSYPSTADGSN